uniref:Uncharacterized protein n=1 Tax=Aegilops tauschii subsp. strangulata TaxID=200361 RepID=A0A453M672_AEGTS
PNARARVHLQRDLAAPLPPYKSPHLAQLSHPLAAATASSSKPSSPPSKLTAPNPPPPPSHGGPRRRAWCR